MSGWNGQFNPRLQRLERLQDSATEVPKPTSADAGKVITVNEDGDGYVLGEGGGSGGGGTAFVVHMVIGIGVEPHLDRSYNEIVAAITNGQAIQVIRSGQAGGYPYNIFLLMVRVGQDGAQSFSADIFDFAASEMLTFRSESADGQLEEEPQP